MEKKNTVLLTVIAIATLLVAVVGATFAFFTAQQDTTGATTVEVQTKAADVFTALGSGALSLDVTAASMQSVQGSNTYTSAIDDTTTTGEQITVSLKAGSGQATCTYDLYYTPSSADAVFTPSAAAVEQNLLEYTIQGSNATDTLAEKNVAVLADAENRTAPIKLNDTSFTITDSGEDAVATTAVWNFTSKFYNLAVDQSTAAGKTYGGSISVGEATCTNTNN